MAEPINILLLLPDVATIGQTKLQGYCDEWLQRPVARQYGVAQINVRADLRTEVLLDAHCVDASEDTPFIPLGELIDYIIDEHFSDAEKRRQLHAEFREARKRIGAEGGVFDATVGRVGTFHLRCKNAACAVLMETPYKGVEGLNITCPPCELTCPACGHSALYDGSDLQLVFKD
jgi:hypothetical protein